MISNGKTLNRLWGALVSDLEVLMGKFMDTPGWSFAHFAKICREMNISLIINMAQGRGKAKDDHYLCISNLILQTAKFFWLRPRDTEFGDGAMDRKRRLGGFYITYIFYLKQPYPGRAKISLDSRDLTYISEFLEDVKQMKNMQEVLFGMCLLIKQQAYSYAVCADDYGIEGWRRSVLTNQKSETVTKCFEMRNIQDWLAYGTHHHEVDRRLLRYNLEKTLFGERMKSSILKHHLQLIIEPKHSIYGMFSKTDSLDGFQSGVKILTDMTNKPILTLEQLTATDSIDRRILAETRRRITRQRKKIMEDPTKASQPYVREGGIYGRKKEVEEEKVNKERRERGMCSGNLWTYINALSFDKPLGHLPDENNNAAPQASGAKTSNA